jgi:hypothetical protein
MTPKEKAEELVEKMHTIDINDAKLCALIAVDELIYSASYMDNYKVNWIRDEETYSYWQEVKQEIIKL